MFKIFSHNDLDGYSINVVCNYFNIKADIRNINNKDVNKILMDFFEAGEHKKFTRVFLCDIYISEEVAEYIDSKVDNFVLIDHHKSGEYLNRYSWAKVHSIYNGRPSCATELFYKYLIDCRLAQYNNLISTYVESVRLFDTAEYIRQKYNEKYLPEELSILFFIYFRNYWKHLLANLKNGYIMSYADLQVCKNMLNKIEIYSKSKQKDIIFIDFDNIKTAVFFIEDPVYISKILRDAKKNNPEINLFMFIKLFNSISLRSFNNCDASKIAINHGGGGHEFAAGIPYDNNLISQIILKST